MAKKPNFDTIDTGRNDSVLKSVAQATSRKGQQNTATPAEAEERAATLRTQGRKGCKAVRINMAFTTENHTFIKTMARISGQTMTEFTNFVIERYRTEHPDLYEKAKDIIDNL